jgi:hypothetical protein
MTWFATSANEVEADKSHCFIFLAVDFDFPSGHARFWTGIGDLSFGSNVYTGSGELGSVSVPSENVTLSAEAKTYRLSGVDPSLIDEDDLDDSFGRAVTEYFGFLTPVSHLLVATPEINWEGRIDTIRRVDGAEPFIEVTVEHRMILLERSDQWRYTDEHQQQFFAGDKGFDRLASLENKEVIWGGKKAAPPGAGRTPGYRQRNLDP